MTFLNIFLFATLLTATPLDLGGVAQDIIDKSVAIAVLVGVIYYMLRAAKANRTFYKELRDEDKVESAKEKEELHATFAKQEDEKKITQKYFESAMDTLMKNQKEAITSIIENNTIQINSLSDKHSKVMDRLLSTIDAKDVEILTAYKKNIASQENLANLIKYFSESQAEHTGKITESIHSKFEQIFTLLRSAKIS